MPRGNVVAGDPGALLRRYRTLCLLLDVLAGAVAGLAGLYVRFGAQPVPTYTVLSLMAPVLWVCAVAAQRGYEKRFLGTGSEEYRRLASAIVIMFAGTAMVTFTLHGDLSRGYVFVTLPGAFVASLFARHRLRIWLFRKRLAGHGLRKVLALLKPATRKAR